MMANAERALQEGGRVRIEEGEREKEAKRRGWWSVGCTGGRSSDFPTQIES